MAALLVAAGCESSQIPDGSAQPTEGVATGTAEPNIKPNPPANPTIAAPPAQPTAGVETSPQSSHASTPAGAGTADIAQGVQALLDYHGAINRQQYEEAYLCWLGNGAASNQTLEQFASGFSDTVDTTVLLDKAVQQGAGEGRAVIVPVRLMSVVNDETAPNPERQLVRRFEGTYTLQSTPDGWRIASADVREVAHGAEAPQDLWDPATLLDSYLAAINVGEYERAYTLWKDLGQASGQTYAEFAIGYAATEQVSAELGEPRQDAGAGNVYAEVPVVLFARQTDGTTATYCGTYTVHRANVPPFDQFGWRILGADISLMDDVQPGSAETESLLQLGCQ